MKIDILRQRENKVLNRREIDFRIEHVDGLTPSRADMRAKIAAQFDADPLAVVIRRLKGRYGIGITEGTAMVYKDAAQAKSIEIGYILKRHEPKKEGEEEAKKPAEKVGAKGAKRAEKKKPEKKAERPEKPEKEAEKAEKKPEKEAQKPEKPEKEAEKPEKRPEKKPEKAEKKKAETADDDEEES